MPPTNGKNKSRMSRNKPNKTFAKKVLQVVHKDQETKRIDQGASSTGELWSATTRIHSLTPITRGDASSERDGNEVLLKRLIMSLYVDRDPTSTPRQGERWRYTIFKWDRDAVPSANQLYTSGNIMAQLSETFYTEKLGYILKDEVIELPSAINAKQRKIDIPLNFRNSYHGALATNNSAGMVYIAIGTDTADPQMNYEFGSRVFYKDI